MASQIALLGADDGGLRALLRELAPRLCGTGFFAQVIEEASALQATSLALLLAANGVAGEAQELRWRETLARAGIGYSVLHGDEAARLDAAWRLIQPLLGQTPLPDSRAESSTRWNWSCEKCSDPACEHRLFQDLLQSRRGA